MIFRNLTILCCVMAVVSCDKTKKLVEHAKSAIEHKVVKSTEQSAGLEASKELKPFVDQTAEGVVFRKDIPFPKHLEVRTTAITETAGQLFSASEIGKKFSALKLHVLEIYRLELNGDKVQFTMEKSDTTEPVIGGNGDPKKPAKSVENPLATYSENGTSYSLRKTGEKWIPYENNGFRAAVISKQLSSNFKNLMIEDALAPHPLWFSKRRFKIGDELTVTGEALPMLLMGNAKGNFKLKLTALEAVAGHPCGVFTVCGDFSRKKFPDFSGNFLNQDVTIESGKIWLSLLYPIILKTELETIQTTQTGGGGGQVLRVQGSVKVSLTRDWRILP